MRSEGTQEHCILIKVEEQEWLNNQPTWCNHLVRKQIPKNDKVLIRRYRMWLLDEGTAVSFAMTVNFCRLIGTML